MGEGLYSITQRELERCRAESARLAEDRRRLVDRVARLERQLSDAERSSGEAVARMRAEVASQREQNANLARKLEAQRRWLDGRPTVRHVIRSILDRLESGADTPETVRRDWLAITE